MKKNFLEGSPATDDMVFEHAAIASTNTNINAHKADTANPHGVTKGQVGLGSVDNTTDANKPVSILTQVALDLKANITQLVKFFRNTVLKTAPRFFDATGTCSGWVVTFDLTDGSGNAVFSSLTIGGCSFETLTLQPYRPYNWSLSGDRKTLTISLSYAVLGALIYSNAPNGTVVYLTAHGE